MHRLPAADPADLAILDESGWFRSDAEGGFDLVDLIATGPDPIGAVRRLAELGRSHPSLTGAANEDAVLGRRLVSLCGGSRALSAVLARSRDPRSVLAGVIPDPENPDDLTRWVRESLAAVAAADLAGELDMPKAGARVAAIADRAAACAVEAAVGEVSPEAIAVVAMGKWGGRELNYASDIDLVFVHEGSDDEAQRAAGAIIANLEGRNDHGQAFRVDADLRPEGAAGPLSRSLESYRRYWERWAETWELQALVKARPAAGSARLGSQFLEAAHEFVFPEHLGADAVRSIRSMKERAEGQVKDGTELKRGVGGIRDVEFAVQLLQLVHGRADSDLRTNNTLEALDRLADGGYVHGDDAAAFTRAYHWLRDAEHRIQLYDLRQTHTLPAGETDRERVARSMGYRDSAEESALAAFEGDLAAIRRSVRSTHEQLFHRPVLESLAASTAASMPVDAVVQRLEAFGFLDTDATRVAVKDLTKGLSRRSALMRHMLPLIMEWLSVAPDPDMGLAQLRLLLSRGSDSSEVTATLRDDPVAAERLCLVLGTSKVVGRLIDRLPPLVPDLGEDEELASWPAPVELAEEATGRLRVATDAAATIRRFHAEHLLRIAVADIVGLIDDVAVGRRLADLSDATVQAAVAAVSDGRIAPALVAMGKWGGRELTYASDLDAIAVVENAESVDEATQVLERVVTLLGGPATGLPSLELDLELRPEGRKGPLVRSLESFDSYYRQWVETWELQAMLRARPTGGDQELGQRLVDLATEHIYEARPGREREIRMVKARVEKERIPVGDDPDFHLKLGRGSLSDIEWTVQLLQMQHGAAKPAVRNPSTLDALAALEREGILAGTEAGDLGEAYRFCSAVRNRLFLQRGGSADSLPQDTEGATRLARSLGYTSAPRSALREDYRRTTRRARAVVEHRFYGMGASD